MNNCGWCYGANFRYDECICEEPCEVTSVPGSRKCRGEEVERRKMVRVAEHVR